MSDRPGVSLRDNQRVRPALQYGRPEIAQEVRKFQEDRGEARDRGLSVHFAHALQRPGKVVDGEEE